MIRQEVFPDSYFTLKNICEIREMKIIVKSMVDDGFRTECLNVYNIYRSKFMNKCLCRLGLQEVNLNDIKNENIGNLINAFNTALKILLPNERMIWHHIFPGLSTDYCIFFLC